VLLTLDLSSRAAPPTVPVTPPAAAQASAPPTPARYPPKSPPPTVPTVQRIHFHSSDPLADTAICFHSAELLKQISPPYSVLVKGSEFCPLHLSFLLQKFTILAA